MLLYQVIILAIIQGITEFLPVSSSGHLIIFPHFFQWPDQGLDMDVAVHVGTLGAVLIYFWRDVLSMFGGALSLIRGKMTKGGELFVLLCIGTIPAIILGFLLSHYNLMDRMRSVEVIAWTMIVYGVLLYFIDKFASVGEPLGKMTGFRAFVVGIAQALALIPGTSRSGACITMMRVLGYNRADAAKFSFLLSIPAISAAAVLQGYKMYQGGRFSSMYQQTSIAAIVSFVAGLLAINFMLTWLRKGNFTPFVIYRLGLGAFLLFWAYYL